MTETTRAGANPSAVPDRYIGSLDGLRFFAFLLVFIHHSPDLLGYPVLRTLGRFGWVGVDLFFAISSFLFFYLLGAEMKSASRIDAPKFYLRRILRIYPLMILFPLLMWAIFGNQDGAAPYRFLALTVFVDNFVTWFRSYNASIAYSGHLWTLSFEFQIYLLIPFVFLAYNRIGAAAFLKLLGGVFLGCLLARIAFFGLGAQHPIIWVTPFLRPESILAGMALAVLRPAWRWEYSLAVAVVAALVFTSMRLPWSSATSSAFSYPVAALMCAALIDLAIRAPGPRRWLSWGPVRWLGAISFGLYVYHLLAIGMTGRLMAAFIDLPPSNLRVAVSTLLSLLMTIALAALSYRFVERPFLRLKDKVTVVVGRPV